MNSDPQHCLIANLGDAERVHVGQDGGAAHFAQKKRVIQARVHHLTLKVRT